MAKKIYESFKKKNVYLKIEHKGLIGACPAFCQNRIEYFKVKGKPSKNCERIQFFTSK